MIKKSGLTLIEVLIALAIIGIALTAIMKSTTQSIHSTSYLQNKMIATWIGQNVLNEVRLGVLKLSKEQNKVLKKERMLNRNWYFRAREEDTANAHIKKITVSVYDVDDGNDNEDLSPLTYLEGYVYHAS